jgi:hypothetical protein
VGAAPQPLHRQWLHALEDDLTVPAYVMQVARVYADFAARSKDGRVHVNWRMLRRCTHQRNDRITQSLDYLMSRGWLIEEPAKRGERKHYYLSAPPGGSTCRAVSAPVDVSTWEVA